MIALKFQSPIGTRFFEQKACGILACLILVIGSAIVANAGIWPPPPPSGSSGIPKSPISGSNGTDEEPEKDVSFGIREAEVRQGCSKTEDEKFEEEIVNGKCRQQFVELIQESIKQGVYATVPEVPNVDRGMIARRAGYIMGKIIDENMTGRNVVDACAITVQIILSTHPATAGAASAGKPFIRKGCLQVLKNTCRVVGCCVKNSRMG